MNLKNGELMSSGDAARALGISIAMVGKIEDKGQLSSVKTVGGFRLYWTKEVQALVKERVKNPPRPGRKYV